MANTEGRAQGNSVICVPCTVVNTEGRAEGSSVICAPQAMANTEGRGEGSFVICALYSGKYRGEGEERMAHL